MIFLLFADIVEEWAQDPFVQRQIEDVMDIPAGQLSHNLRATRIYLVSTFTPNVDQESLVKGLKEIGQEDPSEHLHGPEHPPADFLPNQPPEVGAYSVRYEVGPHLNVIDQTHPLGTVEFSTKNVEQMMVSLNAVDPYVPFAVLNFANKSGIGGAQEGAIAAATTLADQMNKDNLFHLGTQRYKEPIPLDGCIYTKGVKLKNNGHQNFSIISSATASRGSANTPYTPAEKNQVKKLIKMVLDVARDNGIKVIVLGPWGCGVFHHPALDAANAFEEVINEGNYFHYFDRIIFAAPPIGDPGGRNASAFEVMVDRIKEVIRVKNLP